MAPDVAQAEADAERAKQQLVATATMLKARLKPGALARDAGEKIKGAGAGIARAGVDTIKRHPLPTIGVVAALTAFLTRKPLARLFRRKPKS